MRPLVNDIYVLDKKDLKYTVAIRADQIMVTYPLSGMFSYVWAMVVQAFLPSEVVCAYTRD